MIRIDEKLRTDRLLLRARVFDDNAFVFEATRHPGFNDGMPWDPPLTIKEIEEKYYSIMTKWIDGEAYSFVIMDRKTDYRLGMVSIRKTGIPDAWDIGYWVHPENQRQGIMKEAAAEILKFGFERLGATSIQAKYAVWNIGSEKILKHIGMRQVEYLEKGFEKNGEWVKENRMEIRVEEWRSSQ